jgi:hypothetical protein
VPSSGREYVELPPFMHCRLIRSVEAPRTRKELCDGWFVAKKWGPPTAASCLCAGDNGYASEEEGEAANAHLQHEVGSANECHGTWAAARPHEAVGA